MKMLDLLSKKTKMTCIGIVALTFLGALLGSLWPVKLGELYTNISSCGFESLEKGMMAVITFSLIYLAAEGVNSIRRVALECMIANHEAEIREKSVNKMLKMPVSYSCGSLSGEKNAQLNQGIGGLSQLIKMCCNDVFATVLTAGCTLYQVIKNASGTMAVIMVAYLALTIFVSVFQIRSQNGMRERIIKKRNIFEGQICQTLQNAELIRSLNAEEYESNRLKPAIQGISDSEKKHHTYMGSFDGLKQLCKIAFQTTILMASLMMISNGKMVAGSVITVCLLFQQLVKPVDDVYRFLDEILSSVIKTKALMEVMNSPQDPVFDIEDGDRKTTDEGIYLEDVVITNPEGSKALAIYDRVFIPLGKVIALIGPNGCGKTSLIRCLNRFYPRKGGKIRLFGNDQEDYSQKELTSMLYYSPQISFFIAGTVRENLMYGLTDEVSDTELINVLDKVRLFGDYEGVIAEDPLAALEFRLSEGTKELSGGMRQRLALARAFLRKPKMFIFDEITANLDDFATDMVLSNIEEYAESINAGVVYISHEQKVVERCDEVVKLDNLLNPKTNNGKRIA